MEKLRMPAQAGQTFQTLLHMWDRDDAEMAQVVNGKDLGDWKCWSAGVQLKQKPKYTKDW